MRDDFDDVVQPLFGVDVFVSRQYSLLPGAKGDRMGFVPLVCQIAYVVFTLVLKDLLHYAVLVKLLGIDVVLFLN